MTPIDDLTRREVFAAGGVLGLGAGLYLPGRSGGRSTLAAVASASSVCTLTPELTEGPYYIDDHLVRSDIREDRKGVRRSPPPVSSSAGCAPIPGATVEITRKIAQPAPVA